jgi:hypothetical protein
MLTDEEIQRRHHYQTPTEKAKELHHEVNESTTAMALAFEHTLPEGREKSIVHTKLEEVRMWANAAIAHNHDKL